MTTLAYDGQNFAADRQMSLHMVKVQKIFRLPNGAVVGGAGDYNKIVKSIRYMLGQGDKVEGPADGNTMLMMVHNKKVYLSVDYGDTMMPVRDKKFAIGSGSSYAMGAMQAGATAKEAIKIAAKLDPDTGPTVDSVEV